MIKKILFGFSFFGAIALLAQTHTWGQDYELALHEAKKTGKYVLMNFSGSDWCSWCKRLDAEVFSQEAFKSYAKDHLVLLLIDTPAKKKLDEKIKKQNETLKAQFQIQGFPTIILLDPSGNKVAQTGYQFGGAEKYVAHLKTLIAQSKAKASHEDTQ